MEFRELLGFANFAGFVASENDRCQIATKSVRFNYVRGYSQIRHESNVTRVAHVTHVADVTHVTLGCPCPLPPVRHAFLLSISAPAPGSLFFPGLLVGSGVFYIGGI